MNETRFQQLLEIARVRALTPAEDAEARAWLATHPAARAEWEAERQLDAVLRGMPDLPVSSNFTARVLAAVERDATTKTNTSTRLPWWRHWFTWPRLATAAAVVMVASVGVRQARLQQRAQLAADVAALSGVATVPSVEMLADFDAILRLNKLPANNDVGVLTALQAP